MSFDDEIREAKAYIDAKLYPCFEPETAWDLFQRSLIGVSYQAFCEALGTSGRVYKTDGRSGAYAKRK